MDGTTVGLQQQPLEPVVLFDSSISKEQYGDHVVEVKFPDPVHIRTISAAHAAQSVPAGQIPTLRAWARDIYSQSAARFVPVLGPAQAEAIGAQPSSFQPTEALFTDHLVLHGKFKTLQLQLHGSVVKQAAEIIRANAEKQLGPLPRATPALPSPSEQQQQQQQEWPPQLQLQPPPLLPLAPLPAAFVQMLGVAVEYWRKVRLSHSRIEANPPNGRLDGLSQLADAVLAALRGKPGALQAKLSAAAATGDATDWAAIQDDALDMAASWCQMLASRTTHTPFDMEVGVAGLAAAILLATCSTTAAQFLALVDERQELAGASAVRGVVCIRNAPPVISRYGIGLLELLLGSCPTVACATLLGAYTPVLEAKKHKQQEQQQADLHYADRDHLGRDARGSNKGRHIPEVGFAADATAAAAGGWGRSGSDGGAGASGHPGREAQEKERENAAAGSGGRVQQPRRESSPGSKGGSRRQDSGQHTDADMAADQVEAAGDGYAQQEEDDEGGLYDELDSQGYECDEEGGEGQHMSLSGREDMDYDQQDDSQGGPEGGASQQGGDSAMQDMQQEGGNANSAAATSDAAGEHGDKTNRLRETLDETGPSGQDATAAGTGNLQRLDKAGVGGRQSDSERFTSHRDAGVGRGSSGTRHRASADYSADISADHGREKAGVISASREVTDRIHGKAGSGQGLTSSQALTADRTFRSRHGGTQASSGDSRGREWGGRRVGESDIGDHATAGYKLAKLLRKRREQAVELCSGVALLATQPRREDISASCMIVLRRIKAWECITTLRSTIGEMLDGSVNALLLPVPEFVERMHSVSTAVADLSNLVIQPVPAGPMYYSQEKKQQLQLEAQQQRLAQQRGSAHLPELDIGSSCVSQQQQQADACVLQLLLGFRVLELLSALVDYAAVHGSRLSQQQEQQQESVPQQQQQSSIVQQLQQLCQHEAELLCSVQVLVARLASSPAGWAFLRAAGQGLELLAQAIDIQTKVSLDGGPLALEGPGASKHSTGRAPLSQQLLSAQGTQGNVASELSSGLQRLLVLSQAVGQLQLLAEGAGSSSSTAAAVQALMQACYSSSSGREAAVCALGSCPSALQALLMLLRQRGKVLAAAAGVQDDGGSELAGLEFDEPLSPAGDSSGPLPLAYEALYVPDLLIAVLQEPHSDVIKHWLPLARALLTYVNDELDVQERYAPAALTAAFPSSSDEAKSLRGQSAANLRGGACRGLGLPLVGDVAAAAAAMQRQRGILQQIQGYADTANQLVMHWSAGDGSGSGSGAFLLIQLQQLLPPLLRVAPAGDEGADSDTAAAAAAGMESAAAARKADAAAAIRGAASVSGVPPPWGRDVDPTSAVNLVQSQLNFAATLASFNLLAMLLNGAPDAVRQMVAAAADRPSELALLKPALNPAAALNPNGTLGPGGGLNPSESFVGQLDGLGAQVLVQELLEGGVLEVLERGIRAGVCALEAANSDLAWGVKGGDAVDDLARLRGRVAAASLLLSAASVAASFMLLLARAEATDVSSCGLLDAVACAHAAVVTCHEGLAAAMPNPAFSQHLAAAFNPALSSSQRSAAAAAAAAALQRSGVGRAHLLLLQARQQLSVCLCCWQKCSWWPDAVGAVLGEYPSSSAALNQIAAEEAEARANGESGALPAPPLKQGPRQLFAAITALADMCPDEWPPAGASQAVIAAAEAAAAAGRPGPLAAFERPTHMSLRAKIAGSLELHRARLAGLVSFAASADSQMLRAALVRLAVRAGSLGGGMSPFLVPLLLAVIRDVLDAVVKAQAQLKQRLQQMAVEGHGAAAQQQVVQQAANAPGTPQLIDARRVIEVLIPLAAKPGFKAALLEYKALNMFARYLHKLAVKSKEEPECHVVVGLVLQLWSALSNPDVSLTPLNPRHVREAEDTPLLRDGRDIVAAILASAAFLSPTNMAAAADLLVGTAGSASAGVPGFAAYARGQAALRQGALRWFLSQSPDGSAINAAGQQNTPQTQHAAIQWAAGRLSEVAAAPAADAAHAAACTRVVSALQQAALAAADAGADVPMANATMRFAKAVQESVAAAAAAAVTQPAEDLSTLLDTPAVLLACDITAAAFWRISNATATAVAAAQQQRQKRARPVTDRSAADCALSAMFGSEQLVPPKRPRVQSGAVQWVLAGAGKQEQQLQPKADDVAARNQNDSGEEGTVIPTIMAPRRSAALFKHGSSSRKASMHVDDYEKLRQPGPPAAAAAAAGAVGQVPPGNFPGAPPGPPGLPVGPGRGMASAAQSAAAAAAAGMHAGGQVSRGTLMQSPGGMLPSAAAAAAGVGAMPPHAVPSNMWQPPVPPPPPGLSRQRLQQQQQRVAPSEPRRLQQQQPQRPCALDVGSHNEQQQQQQQLYSPGGGGSDLLGGLEGDSPSYHSTPGSEVDYAGVTEQGDLMDLPLPDGEQDEDYGGSYGVSEIQD